VAKRQTRRSISVRAEVYATLAAHCAFLGCSVSSFVEDAAIAKALNHGARLVPRSEALAHLHGDAARNRSEREAAAVAAMPPSLVEF
jgi:hypothetical protein